MLNNVGIITLIKSKYSIEGIIFPSLGDKWFLFYLQTKIEIQYKDLDNTRMWLYIEHQQQIINNNDTGLILTKSAWHQTKHLEL